MRRKNFGARAGVARNARQCSIVRGMMQPTNDTISSVTIAMNHVEPNTLKSCSRS